MTSSIRPFRPDSALYRPPVHFFRGSLGRFATGVAVVTFDAEESDGRSRRQGITVNSFTSVSMDPPLVLVSIQRSVRSHDLLAGRPFAINVLGAEQRVVAEHFAGRPSLDPVWIEGRFAPRLCDALSHFECTPWAAYDGGDHTLFLGEVQEFDYRRGDALGFVNGQFCTIPEQTSGHEPLF
ncbi:flavin reductase (DIM6/NTAB) family NADH-FMN oxidoreductase RutF [Microbacterium immunditiarum]|uniref:Flavin reductase (DIM6/NTAB) family NADH-FMN oxidoreductase RutF n=2 Tax=Microbacterium immunditiarum TaxID=337480 RepID=A0A7Y9GR59_9MICO|nr:flavin reductase (DIM6/NTAB) family NADH-FMN oxidoreductase RutF [Microbacterium immunditiarum]